MMEWQPVETAPVGEDVLIAVAYPGGHVSLYVDSRSPEFGTWLIVSDEDDAVVTHWMPLPEPPR